MSSYCISSTATAGRDSVSCFCRPTNLPWCQVALAVGVSMVNDTYGNKVLFCHFWHSFHIRMTPHWREPRRSILSCVSPGICAARETIEFPWKLSLKHKISSSQILRLQQTLLAQALNMHRGQCGDALHVQAGYQDVDLWLLLAERLPPGSHSAFWCPFADALVASESLEVFDKWSLCSPRALKSSSRTAEVNFLTRHNVVTMAKSRL